MLDNANDDADALLMVKAHQGRACLECIKEGQAIKDAVQLIIRESRELMEGGCQNLDDMVKNKCYKIAKATNEAIVCVGGWGYGGGVPAGRKYMPRTGCRTRSSNTQFFLQIGQILFK